MPALSRRAAHLVLAEPGQRAERAVGEAVALGLAQQGRVERRAGGCDASLERDHQAQLLEEPGVEPGEPRDPLDGEALPERLGDEEEPPGVRARQAGLDLLHGGHGGSRERLEAVAADLERADPLAERLR